MDFQSLVELAPWTTIAQICNLLLQIFLFKKFLFKPIKEIIAKRQAEVEGVYDEAEKAREDAANAKTSYEQHLLTAKEEADAITTRAMKNAREQSEALISDAKEEAAAIREKAGKDIAQEKKQAANEMKSEISVLAVDLASARRSTPPTMNSSSSSSSRSWGTHHDAHGQNLRRRAVRPCKERTAR